VAGHIRLLSLLLAFDQRPVKQIEQLIVWRTNASSVPKRKENRTKPLR